MNAGFSYLLLLRSSLITVRLILPDRTLTFSPLEARRLLLTASALPDLRFLYSYFSSFSNESVYLPKLTISARVMSRS
jgi:hypothetical protein